MLTGIAACKPAAEPVVSDPAQGVEALSVNEVIEPRAEKRNYEMTARLDPDDSREELHDQE